MNAATATMLLSPLLSIIGAVACFVLYLRLGKSGFLAIGMGYTIGLLLYVARFGYLQISRTSADFETFHSMSIYIGLISVLLTMAGFVMLVFQLKSRNDDAT